MATGQREFDLTTAARAGAGALIVVGILSIGIFAPAPNGAVAGTPTVQAIEGNGPTGYFPDMFVNQGVGNEPQPEAF